MKNPALSIALGLGLGLFTMGMATAATGGGLTFPTIDFGSFGGGGGGLGGGGASDAGDANLRAFMLAIRTFETDTTESAYYRLNGGGSCATLADHPANIGWGGRRLPDNVCRAAGYGAGCVSTAAGAYQIIKPTWNRVAAKLGLTDFSQASQDAVCVELIAEHGALDDVRAGRFTLALQKCASEWASMPGNAAQQRQHSAGDWLLAYQSNGGAVA